MKAEEQYKSPCSCNIPTTSNLSSTISIISKYTTNNEIQKAQNIYDMFSHGLLLCLLLCVLTQVNTAAGTLCPPNGKPRVRREWRTLSPRMRHRVAQAFWTMRNYTGAEGRARYGPNFVSYEEFTLQHVCTFADPRCDQGHFSPAFITFHRGMLLRFENSLRAIDPRIEALPYWDVALDSATGKYRHDNEKYIFSDNFFGSFRGNPRENFAVTNGLFARFPIYKYDPVRHGPQSEINERCLKEGWVEPTRATTCRRCCGKENCSCDKPTDVFDTLLRYYDDCSLTFTRNYDELPKMDGTNEILYTKNDFDICTNATLIKSIADWQNCMDFGRVGCMYLNNPDVSIFPGDDRIKLKVLAFLAKQPTACSVKGSYTARDGTQREVNAHHSNVHFKLAGDIKDVATSVNDPIFFSYHADVDRNSMVWMANSQYMEREWWKFPVDQSVPAGTEARFSGPYGVYQLLRCSVIRDGLHPDYTPFSTAWVPGTLLDDVASSGYPLYNLFGEKYPSGPYTHRDLIEMTSPSNTIYTYDTLEHLYDGCEKPKATKH